MAKKLTKTKLRKRSDIAEAIKRKNPGISDEKKFRIATSVVLKKKRK